MRPRATSLRALMLLRILARVSQSFPFGCIPPSLTPTDVFQPLPLYSQNGWQPFPIVSDDRSPSLGGSLCESGMTGSIQVSHQAYIDNMVTLSDIHRHLKQRGDDVGADALKAVLRSMEGWSATGTWSAPR